MRDYHVLDVFTRQAYTGNSLAVVPQGEGLDGAAMQRIAREFNLSETVFLLPPRVAGAVARVRIFTPGTELPFAGHPTVGAACWLAQQGMVPPGEVVDIVLDEDVGPVPVRIRREPGKPLFAQLTTAVLPQFETAPDAAQIAAALGLPADAVETRADAPRGASCGVPYLLLPLRSREALAAARLQPERWSALNAQWPWATQVYLYCRDRGEADAALLRARMFAPDLGLGEDPATGSAAAALCGHLADRAAQADGTLRWTIEQGYEMQRPSQLYIEADKRGGVVTAVRVGGYAVGVASGRLLAVPA